MSIASFHDGAKMATISDIVRVGMPFEIYCSGKLLPACTGPINMNRLIRPTAYRIYHFTIRAPLEGKRSFSPPSALF